MVDLWQILYNNVNKLANSLRMAQTILQSKAYCKLFSPCKSNSLSWELLFVTIYISDCTGYV